MKIAIVLTGHLRTFDITYHRWKEFSERSEADLYLHLWDNLGNRKDLEPGEVSPHLGALSPYELSEEEVTIDSLHNYDVKNIVLQNYEKVSKIEKLQEKVDVLHEVVRSRNIIPSNTFIGTLSQYYKRSKALKYVMGKRKYDLVFISRPDFYLEEFRKAPEIYNCLVGYSKITRFNLRDLDPSKVYMTKFGNVGYSDFYIGGNPLLLKDINDIYLYGIEQFINTYSREPYKLLCGHAFLTSWINHLNLEPEIIGLLGWIER